MLHTKFQVSGSPGTCFSKIKIWPKSAVNRVLNVYRPGKFFFLYLDLSLGLRRAVFSGVLGLPYRLASLLIMIVMIMIIFVLIIFFRVLHTSINMYLH